MGGFSLVGLKIKHSRWILRSNGLQPHVIELQNGCKIHCWGPAPSLKSVLPTRLTSGYPSPASKPALLFLHGFGADGTIAWDSQVPAFSKHFSLYLPDLLFFGGSTISCDDNSNINALQNTGGDPQAEESSPSKMEHREKMKVRFSEVFQAKCMYEAMSKMGVHEAVVVGHSYGGFVAYHMANLYPSFVKRVVIVSSGIMMDSHTNDNLLRESGSSCIHDMLVPPTLPLFKKSLQFTFNGYIPSWLPSFFYKDIYENMSGDKGRRLQLVDDIILGNEDSPSLPTIEQSTLILWGDKDQIFNISLAHKLKEFLGAKAELCTIPGACHVPQLVNPKELNKLLLSFLTNVPAAQT
ncbi:hypothetical protein GOP47_0003121 [Adiantum capillus-veneris]|uniref:AB hydrolase-1 domain-containing protein n=1 Tax=Adiantum capillus-veneris TaxID=13818 RepID=A0A9D4ZPT8_ADICA|nr:hypothetical protein GOP47_0003121 [Adiantum capillus-veneris]